jgi:pSer/pThr/pTyr-binding forkhead associated (FHA) protein
MGQASRSGTSLKDRPPTDKLKLSFELLSGPMDGLEFHFEQDEVNIGRSDANDLCIALDNLVSRKHCRIIVTEGSIWVEDSISTNGTYREDRRLSERTRLQSGDILRVGLTELRIKF